MKKLRSPAWALLLATLAPAVVLAQGAAPAVRNAAGGVAQAERDAERRETIEQKFTMAFRMLYQSAGVQRIEASDSEDAKKILAEAHDLFDRARSALAANDLTLADDLLNESLRQVGRALRRVPDRGQVEEQRRLNFARRLDEIQAFQASQLLSMQRISPQPTGATRPPEIEQIRMLVHKAQEFAEKDRFEEADRVLASASELIIGSIVKLLAPRTLIDDLKFDSPNAEYEYEMARHHSYEDLVPIAVAKFKPPPETAKQIENLMTKGRNLRAASRKQATSGDFRTAVKTLQEATDMMQRAVELAGVVLPQ